MNAHCHQLVFNPARGQIMAVAEHAARHSQTPGQSRAGHARANQTRPAAVGLRRLSLACLAAFGLVWLAGEAEAQVVAYRTPPAAQPPTLLNTANGVPLVNIRTPNASGVSHNSYLQFDVGSQGLILNNSASNTQTQLAGWVSGNPWLLTGSARVILNEVFSSNPSQLNGYIEVAGARAQVVIANPSGISCQGCGFINATRATLSTGTPIIAGNGNLDAYRVQGGQISIGGNGLDARQSDYTELIARAVQINAGLWAQEAAVRSGHGEFRADSLASTPAAPASAPPAFAIDVAQLGGMYANKITLVGSEAGVGVRNAGQLIATGGDLVLTAAGRLENSGNMGARDTLRADIQGTLSNSGDLAGQNATRLNATGTLTNRGLIDGGETLVTAPTIDNLGGARLYGDHLALAAGTLNNLPDSTGTPVIAARTRLDIGATTLNNSEHALIFSAGDMAIGGTLDSNGRASGQAGTVNNSSATIEALGALDLNAGEINNTNAHFATERKTVSVTPINEYEGSGAATRYATGTPDVWIYNDESDHLHTPDGDYENWNAYSYQRTIQEDQVTRSDPGRILAGGHLTVTSNRLFNDNSHLIAGGNLIANLGTLINSEIPGQRITTDTGSVTNYWRNHQKGRDSTGSNTTSYTPPDVVQQLPLAATLYQQNTAPASTNTAPANPLANAPALFRRPADPASQVLIETDPRFAGYRQWLSSDYLLHALAGDPNSLQKRLGDGFYEQSLIRDQLAQLTGRRFLDNYASDEAQYQALMDNGATFARNQALRPGIALTDAQVAQLTSDIVWLVEQRVTLPDGSSTLALVPQVYLLPRRGDLSPGGALIAGQQVRLELAGDVLNQGSIAGRDIVQLNAGTLRNQGGRISAADTRISTRDDLIVQGGSLSAQNSLSAVAGGDLTVESLSHTESNTHGSRTAIERVAGLYVTGSNGSLIASAGHDMNLIAAAVQSAGSATLAAQNNLSLGTTTVGQANNIAWDGNNYRKDESSSEIGSAIQTTGNLTLIAGQSLSARAAGITSSAGSIELAARDVSLLAGQSRTQVDEAHQHKEKGFLNSTTRSYKDSLDDTRALASTLSGNTVTLAADRDATLVGSNIASTAGTSLSAGRNLSIEAATQTRQEEHLSTKKTTGVMSSGGLGFAIGTRSLSIDQKDLTTTAAASTVGSTDGSVTLSAAQGYLQKGSDVLAPKGDIAITAKTIDIVEARETARSEVDTRFKQSGLTLAITNPVINAIQTARQMEQAASQTKDGRMQALAAANTAFSAYNAGRAVSAGQGDANGQVPTGAKNADGSPEMRDGTAADAVGGIGISLSLGSSRQQSNSLSTRDSARGSTFQAGRDLAIVASGAGSDSNVTIQGSTVTATRDALIAAENEIRLLAARNTASQHSTNSASSSAVGVSMQVGGAGTTGLSMGLSLSASGARGKADGDDVTYTNTHVEAGNTLTLDSGGNTTLQGAVARAKQITAEVGGNLKIESLQDSSTYQSRQQSLGGSITLGPAPGGSLSASRASIDSDFLSVTEQSALKAGDGGFGVNVEGNTQLKGGAITSTEQAVQEGRNTFSTAGTLSTSDLENRAAYRASSVAISLGTGLNNLGTFTPLGNAAGLGKDSGQTSSTTQAAISGIAGNTTARTGDAESGIQRIFEASKVQQEIAAQTLIMQTFMSLAPKAARDVASSKVDDLKRQAALASNEDDKKALMAEAAKWAPSGRYSIAMNVIIGAAAGLPGAAITKETLAWAADEMRQNMIEDSKKFKGICDTSGNCISNQSGQSVGVNGDNFKLAGGRIVLSDWCAESRCEKDASTVTGYKENADGTVVFKPTDANGSPISITQFMDQHPEWRSPLGGHQGSEGQMNILGIQLNYLKGSFWDKLAESYAGTHDTLNSRIWYDKLGNGKNIDGTNLETLGKISNNTNVGLATPFALSALLPPELWNAISTAIKFLKQTP